MIEQAVREFLEALGPDLRQHALFPFDAAERLNWHYIPRERNGAPLKAMNEAQRQAAMALLRAALSERGYTRAEEMLKNYYGPWGRDLSPLFTEYNFL